MKKIILISAMSSVLLLQGCAAALVAGAAGTAVVANDRRTVGAYIDDESIELKINGLINSDENLRKNTHVSAVSVNGQVLLVGQAPGEQFRSAIVDKVKAVPGVRKIHNQIRLMTPTSLGTRAHDSWLTSVVKAKLMASKVDASAIKVVTENGEVYLMGLVNQHEGAEAAQVASNVSGVTRVVKVFEYRQS
ncbi:division/outer membrane stress-associated lipid-binding lipoprotein [Gallaecimonas sp. GXIMD1310]|uniref:division/outer membrane stress-associated lipid-binding lipoprotein n=1 Tax=Gallaecimonas sp. GXIMD1310 TaxID=3131926 RepID=UPI00324C8E8F